MTISEHAKTTAALVCTPITSSLSKGNAILIQQAIDAATEEGMAEIERLRAIVDRLSDEGGSGPPTPVAPLEPLQGQVE